MKWKLISMMGAAALVATSWGQIRLEQFATGLSQPVCMTQDPTQANVQFVVQKTGLIRALVGGAVQATPALDLTALVSTSSEEGALGIAFAPDYAKSGYAYVYYTDLTKAIRIVRYTRSSGNPLVFDAGSAYPILSQAHPTYANHNGGTLRFGPDGYLYAGLGDGGLGNDPNQHGQSPNTLLGKMIRIDPSGDDFPGDSNRNYAIPADNPFVDGIPITAMGEIWDFGMRNPWKWSFDLPSLGGTGNLIIGDVGQDAWEEVDFEPAGTGGFNYGWRIREGKHNTGLGGNVAFNPLTDPIWEYPHGGNGAAIVGGYVYRGSGLGSFWTGRYFCADEVTRQTWSMKLDQTGSGSVSDVTEHTSELANIGAVSSFDVDSAGELYFLAFSGGKVYKLVSSAVAPASYTVFRGVLQTGQLSDLVQSDDQRMDIINGLVANSQEAPVTLQLTTTAPAQTATALRFFLEAQVGSPGLTQTVDLWDYNAGAWVRLDTRGATFNIDQRIVLTATSPNRFIKSGTREMKAQIRFYPTGLINSSRWHVRVDQSVWGFYP